MTSLTEAEVEQAALNWLADIGWRVAYGPDIGPRTPRAEREDCGQVVLARRDAPFPQLVLGKTRVAPWQ